MAARRLLLAMLVLLAISTLAAALVPPPEEDEGDDAPPPKTGPTRGGGGRGELIEAEIAAFPRRRPEQIEVSPGDQLAITVTSGRPGQVAIPDLGLLRFASPGSPARFDLFLDREGRFEVRFRREVEVATIVSTRDDE